MLTWAACWLIVNVIKNKGSVEQPGGLLLAAMMFDVVAVGIVVTGFIVYTGQ